MEVKEFKNNDLDRELLKDFVAASKDPDFKALVNKVNVKEELAIKYTSKFERSVCELKNCSKCKNIHECKNPVNGCVYYPRVDKERIKFDYVACKYRKAQILEEKNKAVIFSEPVAIQNACMKNVDITDKNRVQAIKWVNSFYKNYQKDNHIKGLYLHGSFGSGKSYLLSALLNELAKKGYKATIIYYPEMLRVLKSSFQDDFEEKMELLKKTDLLLIDDIGAESVTPWCRDEILGTILQYRMDSSLPTFFTSNLTIEELETHLSNTKNGVEIVKAKRIIERIKYLTDRVELISENMRK